MLLHRSAGPAALEAIAVELARGGEEDRDPAADVAGGIAERGLVEVEELAPPHAEVRRERATAGQDRDGALRLIVGEVERATGRRAGDVEHGAEEYRASRAISPKRSPVP